MPEIRDNSKEPPEEGCESCHSEVATLKPYRQNRHLFDRPDRIPEGTTSHKWLCELCATTMTGVGSEYPEQYREGRVLEILKAICFVGNAILHAIEKGQRP